jgi:hypothetical protein
MGERSSSTSWHRGLSAIIAAPFDPHASLVILTPDSHRRFSAENVLP